MRTSICNCKQQPTVPSNRRKTQSNFSVVAGDAAAAAAAAKVAEAVGASLGAFAEALAFG